MSKDTIRASQRKPTPPEPYADFNARDYLLDGLGAE